MIRKVPVPTLRSPRFEMLSLVRAVMASLGCWQPEARSMRQAARGPVASPRAFSSEVETGSRQENASNQESGAPLRFNRSGRGSRRRGRRAGIAVSALMLGPGLSGCILGTERPDLNLEVPAAYREGGRRAPDAHVPALDWWRGFRSRELTALMDAAQINNLDIAVAIAQVIQADAQVGVAGAPLLPSATGTATAEQARSAVSTAPGNVSLSRTFSQY